MPLDFVDFAHHYEGLSLSEDQKRAQFEPLADLLDCIARLYWNDVARGKELGIRLDQGTLLGSEPVDLDHTITSSFNDAARIQGAGRRES